MNLMTNDVSHLDDGFLYIHYVWMLPVQVRYSIATELLDLYRTISLLSD